MSYYPSYVTLKCFEVAARHLSFTHAARALHLTQGAVSHHIQKLERQLSVQLFERGNGKLKLTDVGARYLYDIQSALTCIERATDHVRTVSSSEVVVRVAVPPTFAEYWLMARLNKFTLKHPDSRFQIIVCSGGMIDRTAADVAFELGEGQHVGMDSIQVLSLVYRPYLLRTLPCVQELDEQQVPSRDVLVALFRQYKPLQSSRQETWQGWLQQKGLLDDVGLQWVQAGPRYATASLALQAAVDGVGIALLPDYVVSRVPESTQLRCLDPEGWLSPIGYHMFWDSSKTPTGAVRDFIEWARAEFTRSGSCSALCGRSGTVK